MNLKRTATMVAIGAAFVAWLAGAATSNHTIPQSTAVRPTSVDLRGAELAIEIERLHERLAPSAPLTPGRNLFTFRAPAARPVAPAAPAAPRPALSEPPVTIPPPSLPSLKLSGIAEDPGPNGPIRIAFIAGEGHLFMVKVGETVTARYAVATISADVVELLDVSDNTVRRLALR